MSARRILDLGQLIELTRFYAAKASSGSYPRVKFDSQDRWHERIYRDPRVDLWLISWLPEQGTELHDHGGSSGSFTVLSGSLTETVPGRSGSRETLHPAGAAVGFGPHYIHDVRNLGVQPAVSVHAYSPPLTSMTYYDLDGGRPVPIRVLATNDPEHERSAAARPVPRRSAATRRAS